MGNIRMDWHTLEQVNVAAVPIALLCWELFALQIQKDVIVSLVMYPKGCPSLPCIAAPSVTEGPPGLFLAFPFPPAVLQYHPLHQHHCFPVLFPFCPLSLLSKQQFPSLWQCLQRFLLWHSELSQEISFSGMQSEVNPSPFYFELRLNWPGIHLLRMVAEREVFPKCMGNINAEEILVVKMPFYRLLSFLWLEASEAFLSPTVSFYKEFLL